MPSETKTHRILRLILFLSSSNPKTKEECITFMEIKSSAFYCYCNLLRDTGFDIQQTGGKYRIEYQVKNQHILSDLLHFNEEEAYLLSCCIDDLGEKSGCALKLKQKLVSFLNQDKAIESYIHKEKPAIVQSLRKSIVTKKQILLLNYSSGNSQTVRNRMVEPFEFKDDFNLVWAYDTGLMKNRQFKICRIEFRENSHVGYFGIVSFLKYLLTLIFHRKLLSYLHSQPQANLLRGHHQQVQC